jgi:hypothetical protein
MQPMSIKLVHVPCLDRPGTRHYGLEQYARGGRIDVWFVPPRAWAERGRVSPARESTCPPDPAGSQSGRQDSNLRPPGPQPDALTRLRYAPMHWSNFG